MVIIKINDSKELFTYEAKGHTDPDKCHLLSFFSQIIFYQIADKFDDINAPYINEKEGIIKFECTPNNDIKAAYLDLLLSGIFELCSTFKNNYKLYYNGEKW